MAGKNSRAPNIVQVPSIAEKCAELSVFRLAGINLRVGREQTGEKAVRIRVVKIQLQRRMIAGAGDAAHEVVAGQCRGSRPLVSCECMRRCKDKTNEQCKTRAQTH